MNHRRLVISLLAVLATAGLFLKVPAAEASTPDGCAITSTGRQDPGFGVQVAYCRVLGRAADQKGLEYWARKREMGATIAAMMAGLARSAEFTSRSVLPMERALVVLGSSEAQHTQVPGPVTNSRPLRKRRPISGALFRSVASNTLSSPVEVADGVIWGTFPQNGQSINVAMVHLSQARPSVSPGSRGTDVVGGWARKVGGVVAINGNWFGPWDGPAVSDGTVYGGSDHGYTALFGFTSDLDAVIAYHEETSDSVDPRIQEGVSGHPTLVYRGHITAKTDSDPTFSARHPRTVIGLDSTGDILILVTVDGRSSVALGMTGVETAELMNRLGAHDAVMLDGGGSTTMWIDGYGVVNQPSDGLRQVGNQIAIVGR